jgi:choline dehydrogenase-like flavoprotein
MLLIDGRPASDTYDCVVIGSGPAGLSLALALSEANKRVLVFESGGEGEARSELANTIGYGHFDGEYWNAHWTRSLGGTSDVWSGWCTTLRDLDFDNPAVGARWPIGGKDLLPYYQKAAPILDHDPRFIGFETPLLPGFLYRPVPIEAPTRFARKYSSTLKRSSAIDVALGCSVVALDANASRSVVTRIDYAHHQSDATHQLRVAPGQSVVVAAGGIGNAQLLLQPRPDGGVPVGNEKGQVGKYLMEHPHLSRAGECVTDAELDLLWPAANTGRGAHAVAADQQLSLEAGLYGCSLQCSRKTADHDMARYLSTETGRPFFHYGVTARAEMLPSASNRIFLTGERDRWGFFRPGIRCVVDARDFLNVDMTLRALGERLIKHGRGRVRVNNDRIFKQLGAGGGHIIGTTRMGQNTSMSVVDRECRVHGYDNLFVAGSSVFPTSGYANPTLTIVALALRLADTLVKRGS